MVYGISGPHIEGFREGWGLPVNFRSSRHGKPHYWKRKDLTHVYVSLCGIEVDQTGYHPGAQRIFEPGVFMVDRCRRCRGMHQRRMTS